MPQFVGQLRIELVEEQKPEVLVFLVQAES